jgi:hypothetical protein
LVFGIVLVSGCCLKGEVLCQSTASPARKPVAQPQATKKRLKTQRSSWTLKVNPELPHLLSLRATNAPLMDIADELGKKIDAHVQLSPLMQAQKVNLKFQNMDLETAMRALAPQVYIDYVTGGELLTQRKPVVIYLLGYNEPQPNESVTFKTTPQVMMFEGDTEDTEESTSDSNGEEGLLEVTYERNQLSVNARKQSLISVLYEISQKVGIVLDIQFESPETVDVNFKNYSLEDAARNIAPTVRLYVRSDLQSLATKPLRIALIAPTKIQEPS